MSDLTVYKDNHLVEASYKLTLIEQRLMIYCISKLNPEKPERDQIIIIEDFVRQFIDLDKNSAYKQIKKAIESLYERSIKVKDPKRTKEFRWISSKEYYADQGCASISFSPEVMPYLCQLEKQFTKYQLRNISAFKRVYSIRLYELLTQYRSLKFRDIKVIDLRIALQLDNKFSDWFEFRRNVLETSIKEINEKSDLKINYVLIKRGRAIDSISFSIEEKTRNILNKHKIYTAKTGSDCNKVNKLALDYIKEIKSKFNN